MLTNFQRLQEFHRKFDADAGAYRDLLSRRLEFIQEEVREVTEAIDEVKQALPPEQLKAKAHLIKELVDVLYVTYGTLDLMGIDADAAFTEVHASNMSKTPNPAGKAIKGEGYRPAQMEQFIA
jgi:predicted HAD superfamily Cof-like phosphohydrolase